MSEALEKNRVQLVKIDVVHLEFKTTKVNKSPIDINKLKIGGGCACWEEDSSILQYNLQCQYNKDCKILIKLVALFKDSKEVTSVEEYVKWGEENGLILLYPYLREQLFALTSRVGIEPYFLPLIVAK